MVILRYLLLLILAPTFCWGSTHIINQSFFLTSKPNRTWVKGDKVIVLGADKVDVRYIAKSRRKFPKDIPVYWLLSDDQWHFKNLKLNKDMEVLDFAKQLQLSGIQVLPENLCPEPAVIQEKNYDMIVVDSSWILFPHQAELFKQNCVGIENDDFYDKIERAIINAKLKPIVIVSHHGVHSKLVYDENEDSLVKWTTKIHQSLGPMDSISNPAYQKYQEKMNKMISKRNNILFVSANTSAFFDDSNQTIHHIALSQDKPQQLLLKNDPSGMIGASKELEEPVQLVFNKDQSEAEVACQNYKGPIFDFKVRGNFLRFFLGKNYRRFWKQTVEFQCFNLQNQNLRITNVGGSLRSPDFQLRDPQGNYYVLRPLKKEVRLPEILRETIVEYVLLDLQSSINPLGYIIAASLADDTNIPHETSKLVYIDIHQKAFDGWRVKDTMSGFYQFADSPRNRVIATKEKTAPVNEVISTKEMVHRLENEFEYRMDQNAYLKARLFDMLIGDWDRHQESWNWVITQEGELKIIRPFPMDRESAFYKSDGEVSWWRRRRWVDYKLQHYGEKLRNPEAMMVQSMSMDYRYTSNLSDDDWNAAVVFFQKKLSKESIQKAIESLPVKMPVEDQKWIIQSFQKRLESLPRFAALMHSMVTKNSDVVGTGDDDRFMITANHDSKITITGENRYGKFFSNSFNSKHTKELRIYGLNGNDDLTMNLDKELKTKIRMVPGEGDDTIAIPGSKNKPNMKIYDDSFKVESLHQFRHEEYETIHNEFYSQVNRRKYSYWTPILFLASSSPDSGFTLGGGLKYKNAGFQKQPWSSTNEVKANAVLNRAAANIMYVGTMFDVIKLSDFIMVADAGLPRFYGSFFGLGNSTPDLDPTKDDSFYWMRARHLETTFKFDVPLLQYVWIVPKVQFRFRDYKIDPSNILDDPAENLLDTTLGPGTNANIAQPNYYVGGGLTFKYMSNDLVSGPLKKRTIKANLSWETQKGLTHGDGTFHKVDFDGGLTGYFQKTKTQWKAELGFGTNFGDWEFFDAQYLGSGQNLRGFFTNRFAGSSRVYDSFQINQSLIWKKNALITDYGLGAFFDHGRVFLTGDAPGSPWHKSIGGQAWITLLNAVALRMEYAHAIFEDEKGFWSFQLTTDL